MPFGNSLRAAVDEGSSLACEHTLPGILAPDYGPRRCSDPLWVSLRRRLLIPWPRRHFRSLSYTCSSFKLSASIVAGAPPDLTSPLLSCRASQGESCTLILFFFFFTAYSCLLSIISFPLTPTPPFFFFLLLFSLLFLSHLSSFSSLSQALSLSELSLKGRFSTLKAVLWMSTAAVLPLARPPGPPASLSPPFISHRRTVC